MNVPSEEQILSIVYRAIDELNPQLPADRRLEKSPDAVLFGRNGHLDSIGLVNLIVAVEQSIEDDFGISVALADEKAVSQRSSPFRSVGVLAAYVRDRLEERARSD